MHFAIKRAKRVKKLYLKNLHKSKHCLKYIQANKTFNRAKNQVAILNLYKTTSLWTKIKRKVKLGLPKICLAPGYKNAVLLLQNNKERSVTFESRIDEFETKREEEIQIKRVRNELKVLLENGMISELQQNIFKLIRSQTVKRASVNLTCHQSGPNLSAIIKIAVNSFKFVIRTPVKITIGAQTSLFKTTDNKPKV